MRIDFHNWRVSAQIDTCAVRDLGSAEPVDLFVGSDRMQLAQLEKRGAGEKVQTPSSVIEARKQYELALKYINAKDLANASTALEMAVSLDPDSADINGELANVLYQLGRDKDSEMRYRRAISLSPGEPMLRHRLALVLKRQSRVDEMLKELELATGLQKSDPAIWSYRAMALYGLGKKDAAIAVLRDGVDRHPISAVLHLNLAKILWEQERLDEARLEFGEVQILSPDDSDAKVFFSKGGVTGVHVSIAPGIFGGLRETLAEVRTIQEIRKVLAATPTSGEVAYISERLLWCGRPLDAVELIEGTESGIRASAAIQMILGRSYLAVLRFDDAIEAFRKAMTNNTSQADVKRLLDETLQKKAKYIRSREEMELKKDLPR